MRIALVLPPFSTAPSGGYKVIYEYANRLVQRGHTCHVLFLGERGFRRRPSLRLLTERRLQPGWFPIDGRVQMEEVAWLSEPHLVRFDAVVLSAWQTAESYGRLQLSGQTALYLVQGNEVWSGDQERIHATWRLPVELATVSRHLADLVASVRGAQVPVIPNGIDPDEFWWDGRLPSARPLSVGMVWAPGPAKSAQDGLEALNTVRQHLPSMKASVVSAFPRPANIPRWVDWVYRPRQTSLRRCYNGMRVFLCSSSSEGFGLPNLEAMACGATLVATDLPAFREYGRHGENGLFSPPGEPAALAESLLQVLTDDELCDQLARDGLVTASRFRWDDSVDVLESLILERVSRLRSLSP